MSPRVPPQRGWFATTKECQPAIVRHARERRACRDGRLYSPGFLFGILMLCGLGGCDDAQTNPLSFDAASEPVLEDDYADARAHFKSHLLTRAPSPQDWEPLVTPAGAERVTYEADELELTAFVDADPGDGRKHPAVLFLHNGFAFGEGDWEMPQLFRDAGFIVMIPILRGENGQPGDFSTFFDEVDDVLAAGKMLANLSYVDAEQVFLAGHSSGGTLAALAALATSDFRGAASFSGSMDQAGFANVLVYDPRDRRELAIRSPHFFATSFKCPTRLYYGDEEFWTEDATRQTSLIAQHVGLNVHAVKVKGDHFTALSPAMQEAVQFFQELLNPAVLTVPPAPPDAEPPTGPVESAPESPPNC